MIGVVPTLERLGCITLPSVWFALSPLILTDTYRVRCPQLRVAIQDSYTDLQLYEL